MTTLWHKDRYWPAELSLITGAPIEGAIQPGIYAESKEDWERVRKKGFRQGVDRIRRVGVSAQPGIAPAGLMMNVASPAQLAWLKANETAAIPALATPALGSVRVALSPVALVARRA
ncbi:hypothetical protein [Methylorubrum extorquens]|uniref:Uncharacterized protein n=1 Tax=Methylorubrum extorquens TaxID=408 RepID=A0AAX3WP21_METEX|nr:hypothetical protein [Methylorubrum extorquens]WHQ71972.1 hypothetical protein KEC54_10700 [Methylorubrum extorquens]